MQERNTSKARAYTRTVLSYYSMVLYTPRTRYHVAHNSTEVLIHPRTVAATSDDGDAVGAFFFFLSTIARAVTAKHDFYPVEIVRCQP